MKKITLIAFWLGLIVSTTTQAQTDNPDILTVGDSITAGLFRSSGGVITCAALGGAVIAIVNGLVGVMAKKVLVVGSQG